MRAKITVHLQFESRPFPVAGSHANSGELAATVEDFIRDYVAIGIFSTADNRVTTDTVVSTAGEPTEAADPWVDFTPLRYFDRPNGEFLPLPPLMWRGRDVNAQIMVRRGEHGTGLNPDYQNKHVPIVASGQVTGSSTVDQNVTLQLGIIVESLFVPSPEDCGTSWPGALCPPHKIGLHPKYQPKYSVFERVGTTPEDLSVTCTDCGTDREAPSPPRLSILDPRHNLREGSKQMLLLEDHLFHPDKWCPDCVHKHCLFVEALGEEGVTLDKERGPFGDWAAQMGALGRSMWQRLEDGADRTEIGNELRAFRKQTTRLLR